MKKSLKDRDSEKLVLQLDQLRRLSAEELIKQWQALFGAAPPQKLRSSLIVQGIAYRLQEESLGGLKPSTLRLLERIADDTAAGRLVSIPSEKPHMTTGTVLMREWHGKKHQVTVDRSGRRISLPHKALSLSVANRSFDHRSSMVRSALLRTEVFPEGAAQ